jgi:hypothetical protein
MPISQLLIETDVLAEFLIAPTTSSTDSATSLVRSALQRYVCYTTMLNALELFRAATTAVQREAVLSMLYLVRVLGFNARYADSFATLMHTAEQTAKLKISDREAMIIGMAEASKLAILTKVHAARYAKIGIVPVLSELPPILTAA